MATFQINLLGGFELRDPNGQPVALSSNKGRALLACLAVGDGRPVPRAKIAALLWGDRGDDQARGSLRQTLTLLRKALNDSPGDVLVSSGDGLSLNEDRICADVAVFLKHAGREQRNDLERVAALYRGPLLEGIDLREAAFEEWLRTERQRFADLAETAMSTLSALCTDEGDIASALALTKRLLKLDPLKEETHRLAMRLHARNGDRNEALRQFQQCESALASELGVAPQEETGALYESILAGQESADVETTVSTGKSRPAGGGPDTALRYDDSGPSLAVLPFAELVTGGSGGGLGDAFAHDIIAELSRRRWLTVIARGSTFQFRSATADLADLGRVLNVRYALTGASHADDGKLRITTQLAECETGRVLWADGFERPFSDVFAVRRAVSEHVAATVAHEIEHAEVIRTRDLEPADLGAWGLYHRGLWHAFRFNSEDNETARRLFAEAVGDDPGFSNAYAALSFTHFQRAYLLYSQWTPDEIRSALSFAERSLDLDPRNPRGHYAYGRACMLGRNPGAAFEALETSLRLEPGFAQGYYSLGLAQSQFGDPKEAIRNLQRAAQLSPIDPLLFAMISSQAFCHMRLGDFDEAASCAVRGAGKPHAHVQAYAVAAANCLLAGREEDARSYAEEVRRRNADYCVENFLAAFPNFNARDRETITAPLRELGFK